MLTIKKILFLTLLFSSSFIYSQEWLPQPAYKKAVRIGIYTPSKAELHTKIVSDIVQEYIDESRYFDTSPKQIQSGFANNNSYQKTHEEFRRDSVNFTNFKIRFDTCDVIVRAFSMCTWSLSLSINPTVTPDSAGNFFYDTFYVFFAKKEDVKADNYKQIMKRDTLNYLVAINNLRSEPYKKYYNIEYSATIYSKKGINESHKMISNYLDDFQEGTLLPHETPIQCLASHLTQINMIIVKKLVKDGLLSGDKYL